MTRRALLAVGIALAAVPTLPLADAAAGVIGGVGEAASLPGFEKSLSNVLRRFIVRTP